MDKIKKATNEESYEFEFNIFACAKIKTEIRAIFSLQLLMKLHLGHQSDSELKKRHALQQALFVLFNVEKLFLQAFDARGEA